MSNSSYFPFFMNIRQKEVLIIGGGEVAFRRVQVLLNYGPILSVVSPEVCEGILSLAQQGKIKLFLRPFQKEDCRYKFMVIAASNNRAVNKAAAMEAERLQILSSVADAPLEGNFFFPAVFCESGVSGGLISAEGKNHSLVRQKAALIRNLLKKKEGEF